MNLIFDESTSSLTKIVYAFWPKDVKNYGISRWVTNQMANKKMRANFSEGNLNILNQEDSFSLHFVNIRFYARSTHRFCILCTRSLRTETNIFTNVLTNKFRVYKWDLFKEQYYCITLIIVGIIWMCNGRIIKLKHDHRLVTRKP